MHMHVLREFLAVDLRITASDSVFIAINQAIIFLRQENGSCVDASTVFPLEISPGPGGGDDGY
jgi:hypothetical protein